MVLRALIAGSLLALVAAIGLAVFATTNDDDRGKILFRFEGESMEPNFHNAEVVCFDQFDGELERFQVILFNFPLDPERDFAKRVIALPGESVEVRDGVVRIDREPLEGDVYQLSEANYTYGPATVPEGRYFVLGDNRRNSFDSHAWSSSTGDPNDAFVPADLILGELGKDERGC